MLNTPKLSGARLIFLAAIGRRERKAGESAESPMGGRVYCELTAASLDLQCGAVNLEEPCPYARNIPVCIKCDGGCLGDHDSMFLIYQPGVEGSIGQDFVHFDVANGSVG